MLKNLSYAQKGWMIVVGIALIIYMIGFGPAACANHQAAGSDDRIRDCAIENVKRQMRDPFSAVVENVYVHDDRTITGTVNAKNALGAYTGPRQFRIAGPCNGDVTIMPLF